jgi:hypothetical protein
LMYIILETSQKCKLQFTKHLAVLSIPLYPNQQVTFRLLCLLVVEGVATPLTIVSRERSGNRKAKASFPPRQCAQVRRIS